jgi:hypothetical protein
VREYCVFHGTSGSRASGFARWAQWRTHVALSLVV